MSQHSKITPRMYLAQIKSCNTNICNIHKNRIQLCLSYRVRLYLILIYLDDWDISRLHTNST